MHSNHTSWAWSQTVSPIISLPRLHSKRLLSDLEQASWSKNMGPSWINDLEGTTEAPINKFT